MKRGFIILFLIGVSCSPSLLDIDDKGNALPKEIKKFKDGEVTCWIYENKGISCLKNVL